MNRADKQFLSDVGAPVTGAHTDQTVTSTGDIRGANCVTKARGMHAKLVAQCDRAANKRADREAARAERKAKIAAKHAA